jgi:hypothetical protein
MKRYSSFFISTGLILVLFLSYSCGGEESSLDAWDSFKPLEKPINYLSAYFDDNQNKTDLTAEGQQSIYIDFSDGLIQAYSSNPTNKQFIEAISQKFVNDQNSISWFGLGKKKFNGIGNLSFRDSKDLFNFVTNETNYKDIMAPIKESLERITTGKNDAILITDFEEYSPDGKEELYAYAKDSFLEWIKAGNKITFFYNKYHEVNKKTRLESDKHLFFVVFTYGNVTEKSLLHNFNKAIEGRGFDYKIYELNPASISVKNNYEGSDKNGLTSKDLNQEIKYFYNGFLKQNKPFEYLEFNTPWDENFDKEVIEPFVIDCENCDQGVFTRKIFLNLGSQEAFKINSFRVDVNEISKDFTHFARCMKAKNMKVSFTKDEGGNKVWAKEIREDELVNEIFEKNTDKIKSNYIYSPNKASYQKVEELFDLDPIYKEQIKNKPDQVELKLILHKNYSIENIPNAGGLYRIDFIINEVEENINNTSLNDFKWISAINAQTGENTSLYESLRNVLQESQIHPKGIVYTVFLKFQTEN